VRQAVPGRAAAAMGFGNMLGLYVLGGARSWGNLRDIKGSFQTALAVLGGFLAGYLRGHALLDREDPAQRT